jgi:uncharacterized protein
MPNPPPFLDLFQQLRWAGMELTLEQYDLLQQSLQQGFGLKGWNDLKRLCRILWVKPSVNYDPEIFDRTFDRYVTEHQRQFQLQSVPQPLPSPRSENAQITSSLPSIPPRQMPATQATGEVQSPIAVKTLSPSSLAPKRSDWTMLPKTLPLSLEVVQGAWKTLRRPELSGAATEINLEATLEEIQRDGSFAEVVLRPERRLRAELLLLVDDSEAMLPFRPALETLIHSVADHRITPAQIYRFTVYPEDYLYDWEIPTKAIPFTTIRSRLHRSRTVALILSDAGAATQSRSQNRQEGIATFLEQLVPCIRQLIWLNPLPPKRWVSTTAEEIALALDGRMIPMDAASLQAIVKDRALDSTIKLWSLLPSTANRETI